MRYDLAFALCCCKSFLGSDDVEGGDFYSLLEVDRDASGDEIKRAYKRQSLQMHPDKLAQRGKVVTEEDQERFTRMKEAYEILSDPHKRETYDAIGERGMKWLDEPFSVDPQELAHNFAKSSALDRSKIFGIFVAIAVAVFLLPILICMHVDGIFGPNASWFAVLTPLWIWDVFILFYHSRVIMMGPINRPEHIPPEEWVDPLPMKKRVFSLVRFMLIIIFEIFCALRLDNIVGWTWSIVFIPLYIWEATTLYKKFPLARMRIVTVEDLETALGKPFAEFSQAEKELISKRYSVVPSTTSPEFEAAQKIKTRARQDMVKSGFRIIFVLLLIAQVEFNLDWSWWLIFSPFWIMTFLICYANYQAFAEVQRMAAEKDPTLFGQRPDTDIESQSGNYGAMGKDGEGATAAAKDSSRPDVSEEEKEELKAQVMASGSRMCSKCCSQGFLLIIALLFVGKIQGAGYPSLIIISPFLMVAGTILCCLGCAIFGMTEVPTDGVEFDTGSLDTGTAAEASMNTPTPMPAPVSGINYAPPSERNDPPKNEPSSTLDTEKVEMEKSGGNPEPHTIQPPPQPIDLLDDYEQIQKSSSRGELHDLD